VYGVDFGHNEVVPPPPIPEFTGHFQANTHRVQRLRLKFGKLGDLRLLSHLDLLRLFDRAIRRAALPIAYSGGYHPMPRMMPASALSLGLTSEGEWMDLDLTAAVDPETVLAQLRQQFPPDIPLYEILSLSPTEPVATESIQTATFRLQLMARLSSADEDTQGGIDEGNNPLTPAHTLDVVPDPHQWQDWIQRVLDRPSIEVEITTKSDKVRLVNLRERLLNLAWLEVRPHHFATGEPLHAPGVLLDYEGTYRNDGNLLRPEQVAQLLQIIAQEDIPALEITLVHAHRLGIGF
jgi:uncharacterized protein (DUF2344 family)